MSSGTQRLNAADRFMMVIDQAIRGMGGPGFETMTFVCLDGRADRDRLRRGIAELQRTSPVVTARLRRDVPRWDMQPGCELTLTESSLPSAARQAVLDHASRLYSRGTDPAHVDPLRLHLLHLPDGRDVMLAQYSHVMVDHHRALRALARIDSPEATPESSAPWRDPVLAHLRQTPREMRKRLAREASDFRKAMRGGAVRLGRPLLRRDEPIASAFQTRSLTPDQTQRIEAATRKVTGLPNLSMALLASAFRGVNRFAPDGPGRGRYWQAGLALDLGPRGGRSDVLQNWATLVPLLVPLESVKTAEDLTRTLSRLLRERLSQRVDIGILELVACVGRLGSRSEWALHLLMSYCLCFWYAYLGSLSIGPTFCGAPVIDLFSTGPTWPSVGVTVIANRFADRLNLQLTYMPESVPHDLAEKFFDWVIADLLALGSGE